MIDHTIVEDGKYILLGEASGLIGVDDAVYGDLLLLDEVCFEKTGDCGRFYEECEKRLEEVLKGRDSIMLKCVGRMRHNQIIESIDIIWEVIRDKYE